MFLNPESTQDTNGLSNVRKLQKAPLNRDDGGLLPDAYLHLVRKKAANQ